MESLPNERHIPVWLFVLALLLSMVFPFVFMMIDEYSKCHLIALFNHKNLSPEVFFNLYFGIPLAMIPYGIYLIYKNWDLRRTAAKKFYVLCAAVSLDLFSPFILYFWLWVILMVWVGSGCYKLELKIF